MSLDLKSPSNEPAAAQPLDRLYTAQFFLLWTANFFAFMSLSIFFLFPLYITENGGTKSDIGLLMGVMMLSSVLFRPWVAQMIDSIGRKRSYFLSTLIFMAVPALHVCFRGDINEQYGSLMLLRVMHGIGLGIAFASSYTFVADIIPENRLNEGLGSFGINALIGIAAGPAIAEPIINHFGFTAFFLTSTGTAAISLCFQLFLRDTYEKTANAGSNLSFFAILKHKKMLSVAAISCIFGTGWATQSAFVSPYIKFLGLQHVTLYFLAYAAGAILTRTAGSRLADRIGEEVVVPWAFLVFAVGYLLMVSVNGNGLLMLSGLVIGAGHGFLFPCLNALAIRHEPAAIKGKINGIFTGAIDGGNLVGSVVMGYIGEWFGFTMIFLLTACFLLIAAILFVTLLKQVILQGQIQTQQVIIS